MNKYHNRIKVADLETNEPNKILATNGNGELEFSDITYVTSDAYNGLDYNIAGKSLDARQGKVLKNLIDNINSILVSDNPNLNTLQELVNALQVVQNSLNTILVNNLTTGGTSKALTAEMGKTLQNNKVDKVSGKSLLSDNEISRVATLSNYTHPANHPPEIILQDPNNRFVSDAEKAIWNAKQTNIAVGTTAQYYRGDKTWQTLDKTATGLPNVDNTADANKSVLSASKLTTPRTINNVAFDGSANITINAVDATARIPVSEKGAANGVATLDASGIILTTQLPSYVDDVLEFTNMAGFPSTGEAGKIYVAKDTNKTYRWGGSAYVYITSGAVDSVSGKTGIVTLVKGDVGLGNVDNTADATKNVLSASKLTTPRTINGTTFDGSANIVITDATKENSIAAGSQTQYFRGDKTWQTLDKAATGLSNVDNTADTAKNVLSASKLTTPRTINGTAFDGSANITINAVDATARIPVSEKGVANGVATLDASGLIPTTQLPSYVDDVLEFTNLAGFPATGEAGKIYVAKDTNKTYRWGGSAYVYITSGAVDSVSGKTGIVTLVKGDVGLGSVDNTADATKNVLSASKLTTPRTINGTAFDGSANITITDSTKENSIAAGSQTQYFRGDKTWQTLDKAATGLSNVDNTADTAKNVLSASKLTTPRTINGTAFDGSANITINAVDATARIPASEKGAANGVATLDASGIIPTTQLPSYVDDVLEFTNLAGFPATGEAGKIYVAKDTNKTYRWGGSAYVYITSGAVDSVSGKTGIVTLVKGDVGLGSVDNTADATKNVLSASKLTTPRTINGTAFDGSANITINAVDATDRIPVSEKGAANGVATLDASGIIPTTQLPSYVDDVLEFTNLAGFPATGEAGKIYVAKDTNKTYRWGGSAYVYITSGAVDSVSGKTGIVTLVKGDVGLGSVDNTADATKNVLSASKLTTPRTINGTAFDGSANITITDSTKENSIAAGSQTQYFRGDKTWQTLDKTAAGLANVDNTADATKNVLSASKLTTPRTINGTAFDGSANITINAVDATARIPASEKGVANGVATLDASGIIPTTQLPSYVDDVLEFTNLAGFPATGEAGKIYVAKDTNKTYRWGGSAYVYITSGAVDSVSGKTGIVTLVKGDVGLGSVDNTADATKNVLSASKLTTPRTINGTAFDGSANITITDSTKENSIATGSQTQYFRGDKTWQDLSTAVRTSNLTGFTSSSGSVSASDTVLSAIQKVDGNTNLKLPLTGGTITGNLNLTGNLDGTSSSLITDFILDTHPESSSVIVPFMNNDISYLTLRGGTASATDNIGTVNPNIFDGTPSYTTFNPTTWGTHPEGYVIEMTFHKNFNYSSKVGVSFGNAGWRSKYVKIEMYDAVTQVYSTALETSTNASQIVQVAVSPGGSGTNGFSKMRMTFNDFQTANNFRIAQIWLVNFSSAGIKEIALGRDGGTLYGQLTGTTATFNTVNGSLNGNASSATKLATARTINNVAFDGTSNIVITDSTKQNIGATFFVGTTSIANNRASASQTLTGVSIDGNAATVGNILPSQIVSGTTNSATSNGRVDLNTLTKSGFYTAGGGATNCPETGRLILTGYDNATNIYRGNLLLGDSGDFWTRTEGGTTNSWTSWRKSLDSSNFNLYTPTLTGTGASGTWGINITGNSNTATTLQTARTINGVSFNGSANITINAVDSTSRIASSEKGTANGVATLDASGLIPTSQLPSYVDDVLEYTNLAGFPATGETGKIYVAKDTNKTYRWGGSAYVYITSGAVDSVSGKTGVVTLVKGDVGLGNVDNTSDATKNVLSATKLTTARTINNVAFDGSANITIVDATKQAIGSTFFVGTTSIANNRASASQTLTGVSIDGNAETSTSTKRISFVDGPRTLSDRLPNSFARTVNFDFVNASVVGGSGNYGGVMTFAPWDGLTTSTGDSSYQLAFRNESGTNGSGLPGLRLRKGIDTTWGSWYDMIHSGNYNSYSPTLTGAGASGTWGINISGSVSGSSRYVDLLANRTDVAAYPILWGTNQATNPLTGNASTYAFSCDAVKIQSSTGTVIANSFSGNSFISKPNSDSKTLYVGNVPSATTTQASIAVSNGNLYLDAANTYSTYINCNSGYMTLFGNGAGGPSGAYITTSGVVTGSSLVSSSTVTANQYFNTSSGAGNGYGFWSGHPSSYGILMSDAGNGSYGGRISGETSSDYNMYFSMAQGTNRGFVFRNGTTAIASINADGLRTSSDIIAFSSSDERLKDNVKKIVDPLKKLSLINGYTFDWNDKQSSYAGNDVGVIAQEIEKVMPQIVTTRDNGFKAVKYEKIVPLLIEVCKEQQAQIDDLKQLVNKLIK